MGKRNKIRSGATPEEMLRLLAKAEEKIAKQNKKETESETNNTGNNYVANCNEGTDISSTAVQTKLKDKIKTKDKTKAKTNKRTKEKAYSKQNKKVKEKNSKNINRGATPEEMLQLLAKAEERIAKEGQEELSIENIISPKTEQVQKTEIKDILDSDSIPEGVEKSQVQTPWFLRASKYIKTKVAIFMVLATLSAIALTFGLSMVNFPSKLVRGALTIKKPAQIVKIDFAANETDINAGNVTDLNVDYATYMGIGDEIDLKSDYETVVDAGNEIDSNVVNEITMNHDTLELSPAQPQKATLSVVKSHNQRNESIISSTESDIKLLQSSDNNRWEIDFGSNTSFDFSAISIPTDAQIKSVVVYIEHFEEKQCVQGNLEWSIGTGWPSNPDIWASITAPVKKGILDESVDSWDITSLADSSEKINSLQLKVENNNNVAGSKTLIDYINILVQWD